MTSGSVGSLAMAISLYGRRLPRRTAGGRRAYAAVFPLAVKLLSHNALAVAIAIAAGATIGFLLVPRVPTPESARPPEPEVRLLGSRLVLDEGAPKRAL